MRPDEVMMLYEYAWWARDRLLDAASGMTDEEFGRENGFTYKSLRGILVHAMEAEMIWFNRFLGQERPEPVGDSIMSVEGLKTRWGSEEKGARSFLSGVTEASLAEDLVTRRRTGEENHAPLWVLLTHVANHGTQHRSEAAEALTMVGRSPGSLDFVTFFWEQQAAKR
jgi:uncharacterized damage-inducible protein DinB